MEPAMWCCVCGVNHPAPDEHDFRYVECLEALDEEGLRDPISHQPFYDPFMLAPGCEHTFSRAGIQACLQTKLQTNKIILRLLA